MFCRIRAKTRESSRNRSVEAAIFLEISGILEIGIDKPEFAVLLLLHELMEKLETFSDRPRSFSAIEKATLFRFAVDSDRPTEFTL